jgi:membrane associated rhomboid family serine protease
MIPLRDANPTRRFPLVTVVFIAVNVAVFVYQLVLGPRAEESFIRSFALVPSTLFHPAASAAGAVPAGITLFTSMFLHGGFLHVAGNMLYLWIFGNNVEDAMGRFRFVVFYLLCGVVASYSHTFANERSLTPMIGASGAVSGVLGAYLLLYPRARVLTLIALGFFVRTIEVPAMFILLFWFVLQFLNALVSSGAGGGVAWYAHIGGFAAGLALIGLFKRRDVPFGGGRGFSAL